MSKEISEAKPLSDKKRGKKNKLPDFAIRYGEEAYERIAKIAVESESEKMRFDANKWLCEMAFGKSAGAEGEATFNGVTKIELGGELKRWAK